MNQPPNLVKRLDKLVVLARTLAQARDAHGYAQGAYGESSSDNYREVDEAEKEFDQAYQALRAALIENHKEKS